MPIILLLIAGVLIATSLKGTEHKLGYQLQADFSGPGNFLYWAGSIILIGCLGYFEVLRQPVRYLIALIIVVLVLNNNGIFTKLFEAFANVQPAANVADNVSLNTAPAASGSSSSGGSSGSSSSGILGDIGAVAPLLAFAL